MIGFTIINMAGTIVLITVPPSGSTRVGLFIAFNLMQAFAAVNPAIFLMLSRNSAGSTKKSFTYALTCTSLLYFYRNLADEKSWDGQVVTPSHPSCSGNHGHLDISTRYISIWASTLALSVSSSVLVSCSSGGTRRRSPPRLRQMGLYSTPIRMLSMI
jgi:hypothetical protein